MEDTFTQAKTYRSGKQFNQARMVLEEILKKDPRHYDARILLGLVYHDTSAYDKAIKEFQTVCSLCPENGDVFIYMGNAYSSMGRYDQAEARYREGITKGARNSYDAYCELGKIYEERHDYRKAVSFFEEALRIQTNQDILLRVISLCNRFIGDREKIERLIYSAMAAVGPENIFTRNLLKNELEIAQKKMILSTWPRSLVVTVTGHCNLDCIMCEAKKISWTIPERTLDEIVSLFPYLEHIMWQGGEVFLVDAFKDLLKETRKYPHMKQVIVSNGVSLDEDIIKELVLQPDLTLMLSIDAVEKAVFERIRKGARWEKLLENIRLLNQMRDHYHSPLKLGINVTVMKSNHRCLTDIVDFAGKNRFDTVFLTRVKGNETQEENIFTRNDGPALSFLSETLPAIEKKAHEQGIVLHQWLFPDSHEKNDPLPVEAGTSSDSPSDIQGYICYAPWQRMFIDWHGNVFPDCACRPDKPVGNILEKNISELWNSDGMQNYRQAVSENRFDALCGTDCTQGRVSARYRKMNK